MLKHLIFPKNKHGLYEMSNARFTLFTHQISHQIILVLDFVGFHRSSYVGSTENRSQDYLYVELGVKKGVAVVIIHPFGCPLIQICYNTIFSILFTKKRENINEIS